MEIDFESELHRKALDQVSRLLARYEAGLISAEAFKTGIETVWACLGGLITLDVFQELMAEANAEVQALPECNHVRVFSDGTSIVVCMRTREQVRLLTASGLKGSMKHFGLETEATAYCAKVAEQCAQKGMREVPE